MEQIYHFKITISGTGKTDEEAWNDAVNSFANDPGACPDKEEYEIIEESEG
jgi:hypothetical protein